MNSKMENDKLINAIILKVNGDIQLRKVNINKVLEDYELYSPISKYKISIGVLPLKEIDIIPPINILASKIYNSIIRGESIIISDDPEEIPEYYEILLNKENYNE
jgi:hypothetical protein